MTSGQGKNYHIKTVQDISEELKIAAVDSVKKVKATERAVMERGVRKEGQSDPIRN